MREAFHLHFNKLPTLTDKILDELIEIDQMVEEHREALAAVFMAPKAHQYEREVGSKTTPGRVRQREVSGSSKDRRVKVCISSFSNSSQLRAA